MIINLLKNKTVLKSKIIGIFDLDTSTISAVSRNFLKHNEKSGNLKSIDDLPKSFVLVEENTKKNKQFNIYLTKKTVKFLTNQKY